MKNTFYYLFMLICGLRIAANYRCLAQANTSLSNLTTPTSVNETLLPLTDNTLNLGSAANSWKDIYLDGYLFINGSRWISGTSNTLIGKEAGFSNTTGHNNTGVGSSAGWKNTTGYDNVNIGANAGYNNETGLRNVAVGTGALYSNKSGELTAVGYHALYSTTSYYGFNVFGSAFGAYALEANTTGKNNNAFGSYALSSNTTGDQNCAFGVFTLSFITTGINNSAFGSTALYQSMGNYNTAMGASALEKLKEGDDNCAFGSYAGFYQKGGSRNVYIGHLSGGASPTEFTSGSDNSFLGNQSGQGNKEGEKNCFIGGQAGVSNSSGNYGCFLGFDAGGSNTTGSQNIYLGYSAEGSSGTYTNVVSVGYQITSTASNQARIGNSSTTSIGGYVSWSNISDGRFKKNIKEDVAGLAFISKLRPITYTLDLHAADAFIGTEFTEDNMTAESRSLSEKAKTEKEKIIYTGFIAQEVETAAKEIGYDFSGIDAPKNDRDMYGLRYAEFVVPLVKAVQELDQNDTAQIRRLDELKLENEMLRSENEEIRKRLSKLEILFSEQNKLSADDAQNAGNVMSLQNPEASLGQNIPNPFNNTTVIPFRLPGNYNEALLLISDNSGKIIYTVRLSSDESQISIEAGLLPAGTYNYSLIIDGKLLSTRQMLLTK